MKLETLKLRAKLFVSDMAVSLGESKELLRTRFSKATRYLNIAMIAGAAAVITTPVMAKEPSIDNINTGLWMVVSAFLWATQWLGIILSVVEIVRAFGAYQEEDTDRMKKNLKGLIPTLIMALAFPIAKLFLGVIGIKGTDNLSQTWWNQPEGGQ